MQHSFPRSLLTQLVLASCALMLTLPAQAATTTTAGKTGTTAASSKKKVTKKSKTPKAAPVIADEIAFDTKDATQTEFNCAAGHSFSVFRKADDNEHIALRWKNKLVNLKRVVTDTGADRFESIKHSLVWIGIPAKSMLLDPKKGQQVANDCKSAEQLKMDAAAVAPTAAAPTTTATATNEVAK